MNSRLKAATIFTTLLYAVCALAANDKVQILEELRILKAENISKLKELDKRIETRLEKSFDEKDIDALAKQRQDRMLRQDLFDRLIFQVDTRFVSGDMRQFLSERLGEMAKLDLLSRDGGQKLWKQMTYLSQALRDLPERDVNLAGFIESYLKASSFERPIKAEDYLKLRQYTNGREAVAAASVSLEEANQIAEKRIPQENASQITPSPTQAN